MARIQSNVTERIIKGLKLDVAREKIPDQVASKVVPVYLSNMAQPDEKIIADTTTNENSKTISIPNNEAWRIKNIHVKYTSDATVGSRQIKLNFRDDANTVIYNIKAAAGQSASSVETYDFNPSFSLPAETVATFHTLPIPDLILKGGYDIQIFDDTGVAATDDFEVYIVVEHYDYNLF